jgi:putative flippase GtrA
MHKQIMALSNLIKPNEFMIYFIIGGIATVIDWSTFWLLNSQLSLHYQWSLISGYSIAAIFHYTANKVLTFSCQSKKIGSQMSLYFFVTMTSLICSMGIMSFIVNCFAIEKLYARMLTTILILVPNYLLHKHITFSKKIFLQPGVN